jgi:uncharacterized paraquat-inducible protein A
MLFRQILGLALLIGAYFLLIPGLTEPVLHIITTLDKAELTVLGKEAILTSGSIPNFLMPMTLEVFNQIQVSGTVVIQDTAKSILGTSQTLWQEGNRLVAGLILFFSVIVPALKVILVALSYGFQNFSWGKTAGKVSGLISKWSMADVFVMALIVSFLAIKASSGSSTLVETTITFEAGFYYFLGYCLLSILASQLLVNGTHSGSKSKE